MKKLLAMAVALFAFGGMALAQDVGSQTLIPSISNGVFALTYLHDGYGTALGGLSFDVYQIAPNWRLGGMIVSNFSAGQVVEGLPPGTNPVRWYSGVLLTYDVYNAPSGDWGLSLHTGWKGMDISGGFSDWNFNADHQQVYGVGVRFNIK